MREANVSETPGEFAFELGVEMDASIANYILFYSGAEANPRRYHEVRRRRWCFVAWA